MALRPRHVLITGGSRGIGLSIAQLFAKNAYRCTLISRSEDNLKTAVSSLQPLLDTSPASSSPTPSDNTSTSTAPSTSHSYITGNISDPNFWTSNNHSSSISTQLPSPPPKSANHDSKIDVLVNCAGITQSSIFLRTQPSAIEELIQTNLTGLMIGTRFLMRHGYLRGGKEDTHFSPVIINLSSLLGVRGGHGAVAYAASKAGVLGFTRALATEYATHRVRVNAIVPGYIETDMTKDLDAQGLVGRIPLGRFGTPEEVAHAALFLAENQYAHNCVLNLDGGLSAI
nr:quinone reductase [Shiraia sp. slf14]